MDFESISHIIKRWKVEVISGPLATEQMPVGNCKTKIFEVDIVLCTRKLDHYINTI